jgi:hypothetical protein
MLQKIIYALLFLSFILPVNAQKNASDYESAYKKAQQSFKNNDFEKAQSEFASLSNNRLETPLVPYAFYFNALSSSKIQKYFEAKTTLKNLLVLYPNWSQKDEIYYLLANIAFQEKNYEDAFQYSNSIKSESLQDDLSEMKAHFVQQIESVKVLQDLAKKFPNESILVEKKAKTPEALPTKNTTSTNQINKGYFNFGVLLPLDVASIDPDKTRKNQYALDLYQGMKMAKIALLKEGITVNVFTYDVANDTDEMLELVNNQSFRKMDLLIGPLYANTNKIAMAYCENNQIPIVNPISNNRMLIQDYSLSFLAQPSTVTQAIKASDFVRRQPFLGRNTAIYYTDSENDSTIAETYRQQMQKVGYEIIKFEKITPYSDDIGLKLPEQKVSHVFMATSDKKAGLSMLTALNKKSVDTPLITTAEAFNSSNLSNGSLSGRAVYCLDPEFVDIEKPEADNFRKEYLSKYGVLPSYYAFHGYDLALFWGRLFGKYGYNIRKGLDSRDLNKDGYNFSGYNFNKSQDNQVLPITTFQGYKFVLAK